MKYVWKYGENDNQKYYDCCVGKDHLCVMSNKRGYGVWFCTYKKQEMGSVIIIDKVYNGKIMKKYNVSEAEAPFYGGCKLLSGNNNEIEYLKKKLIHCYENGKRMVTP